MRVWDAATITEVLENATANDWSEKFVLRALLALHANGATKGNNFLTSVAQQGARRPLTQRQISASANVLRYYVKDLVAIANAPKVESPAPKAYVDAATATTLKAGFVKTPKLRKPRKLRTISKDEQSAHWTRFLDEQEAAFEAAFASL